MDLKSTHRRRILEALLIATTAISGAALVYLALAHIDSVLLQFLAGMAFTLSLVGFVWIWFDPDTNVARQSDELLKITSQTLECMKDGMTPQAAQEICELLLPATPAIAVAITDREFILGYAGYNAEDNKSGSAIRTTTTRATLEDGLPRILHSAHDIGLPITSMRINAAIVQPLHVGGSIEGTLKFYYRSARQLSQTQESLARGFAEILSTQMAATALEEQVKLTTSMELKALQAQINPHFLFNTINTIASLIRTDPAKARDLLRDFAVFYRSTLEDSADLIELERELSQVRRYFSFAVARFGEDRLQLVEKIDPNLMGIYVPSFLIQPLVENAIKHGMGAEGKLTVTITGSFEGDFVTISVIDDGAGMEPEKLANMMQKESGTGLGIAVKNVRDRIRGYYGPDSHMEVESALGAGTKVTFKLNRAIAESGKNAYTEAKGLKTSIATSIPEPRTLIVRESAQPTAEPEH